jgi:cytochrome c553
MEPLVFRKITFLKPCGKCLFFFLLVALMGGLLLAWSGLYSVAASRGHWWGVDQFLKFGMRSSVRTHAIGIDQPNLDKVNLIQKGAKYFQIGCASCHGSPGRPASPVARTLLPEPPDLGISIPTWKPNELFWIVKNGLKYTAMPAWPAQERDDEVWAVVAFLLRLPGMKPAEFTELSNSQLDTHLIPAAEFLDREPIGIILSTCSRCHGSNGMGISSGAFPRLDIQTADYLAQQLASYASGMRSSGVMQTAVAGINAESLGPIADYYAKKPIDEPTGEINGLNSSTDQGHMLAHTGKPDEGLPACFSCHSMNPVKRNPLYPAIAGQYASYTTEQLMLFKKGTRGATAASEIMSVIARRMSAEQIEAVSNYLEQIETVKTKP